MYPNSWLVGVFIILFVGFVGGCEIDANAFVLVRLILKLWKKKLKGCAPPLRFLISILHFRPELFLIWGASKHSCFARPPTRPCLGLGDMRTQQENKLLLC